MLFIHSAVTRAPPHTPHAGSAPATAPPHSAHSSQRSKTPRRPPSQLASPRSPPHSFLPFASTSHRAPTRPPGSGLPAHSARLSPGFLTSKYCRREGTCGTFKYIPPVMSHACKTHRALCQSSTYRAFPGVCQQVLERGEAMAQQVDSRAGPPCVRTRNVWLPSRCPHISLPSWLAPFHSLETVHALSSVCLLLIDFYSYRVYSFSLYFLK